MFSILALEIYIPTNSVGGFPSLQFIACRLFDDGHRTSVRWYLIVDLICVSLIISNVEHLFMWSLAMCIFVWRHIYLGLLTIFDYVVWVSFLFYIELMRSFAVYVFWRLIPSWLLYLKIFSPILMLFSHFVYVLFCCAIAFEFNYLCLFFFLFSLHYVMDQNDITAIHIKESTAYASSKSFIVCSHTFKL